MITNQPILLYILTAGIFLLLSMLCLSQRLVYSAVYLLLIFFLTAVIYFLLSAPFLAIAQLIIYTGGIIVLLLFSFMLVGNQETLYPIYSYRYIYIGLFISLLFIGMVVSIDYMDFSLFENSSINTVKASSNNITAIGLLLAHELLIPFEFVAILLLFTLIGITIIIKK